MKYYLLERKDEVGYNEQEGVVVAAFNSQQARQIASNTHGDEGATPWLDPKLTSCRQVTRITGVGVILRAFNAG